LREIIEKYGIPVCLTANQDIILTDIEPKWKKAIDKALADAGIRQADKLDGLEALSIACPALPLCGLAFGEAERGLPDVQRRLREILIKVGLPNDSFLTRMTGCPNGCARPYMAEVGFVGDGPNSYQIWLGGCPDLTRLARAYAEKVKVSDIEEFFEPLFQHFKDKRMPGEAFGDFCDRVSFEELKKAQAAFQPS
jgi:sulfite reductase (ferredoxin)